jgi:hypothetical protein
MVSMDFQRFSPVSRRFGFGRQALALAFRFTFLAALFSCQDPTAKPITPIPVHKPTQIVSLPVTPSPSPSMKPVNSDAQDLKTLCEASVYSREGTDVKSECASIANPNIKHFCDATTTNAFSDDALDECKQIDEKGNDYFNLCTALVESHKNVKLSRSYCERINTDDVARLCYAWIYAHHTGYDSKQFCLAISDQTLSDFCDANVPAPGYKDSIASCERISPHAEIPKTAASPQPKVSGAP